jgi:alkanesulfonate monooxygenase SsuD/methylene tetrahydromethanopterin reductase-like flavin-dependent oxidoreductase (luciferase family)/predicted kinase
MLPDPVVVVMVGPAGSGKSRWAADHFAANQIVSSDSLRAAVGRGESDLDASTDAFSLLATIVGLRMKRRLSTVIDTLGFDPVLRSEWMALAKANRLPCHAVIMSTPDALCKERNRGRTKQVPANVLADQLKRMRDVVNEVAGEPFDSVHTIEAIADTSHTVQTNSRVPIETTSETESAGKSRLATPGNLRFGLQLSAFPWPAAEHHHRMTEIAQAAESAGFDSIWVMDHFRQIPQLGREWDDMYEATSTLAFLAAKTSRVTLGTLVASVTHRNIGVLGKSMATLDVLSGGRAICGLGLGWFAQEHAAYGLNFPSVNERYSLLEDALQALPLLWGKGAPAFQGAQFSADALLGYPRPLQDRLPILVGGSGEKRTLKLAAQYGDACNVFGAPEVVARKVAALQEHCRQLGRPPEEVAVTHLATALAGSTAKDLAEQIDRLKVPKRALATMNPGTIHDHIERSRALHAAGAQHLIVSLPGCRVDDVIRYGGVIAAFKNESNNKSAC